MMNYLLFWTNRKSWVKDISLNDNSPSNGTLISHSCSCQSVNDALIRRLTWNTFKSCISKETICCRVAMSAVGGEQSAVFNIRTPRERWVIAGLTFFHYVLVWAPLRSAWVECSADSTPPTAATEPIHTRSVHFQPLLECWLPVWE